VLQLLEFLAAMSASLFAGAALYINVAEHPARMTLDTSAAATVWAPSYKRATWLQAPLAVLSLVTGLAACALGGGARWGIAALLMGSVVPFTFIGIMPTNNRLLAPDRDLASAETRSLLGKWARLHLVRTVLSAMASGLYLWILTIHRGVP